MSGYNQNNWDMGFDPSNDYPLSPTPFDQLHFPAQDEYQMPAHQGYQTPAHEGYQIPAQEGYQIPVQEGYQIPAQRGYPTPEPEGFQGQFGTQATTGAEYPLVAARDDNMPGYLFPEPAQQMRQEAVQPAVETPWTYAVEVKPAFDHRNEEEVQQHIIAVRDAFRKKRIDFGYCITSPVEGRGVCRRYTIPLNIRDSERTRLDFLQVFNSNRQYNRALENYQFKMSVVSYEPKHFNASGNAAAYPDVGGDVSHHHHHHHQQQHHHPPHAHAGASPFSPSALNHLIEDVGAFDHHGGHSTLLPPSPAADAYFAPLTPPEQRGNSPSPAAEGGKQQRSRKVVKFADNVVSPPHRKSVLKPNRGPVEKNEDGLYECSFPDCNEATRTFARKCEWGKHMDKHDRPYRCPVKGCEKLLGFTYSGGLLRHAREVHNDHGGPKNLLYCPHPNCKRHIGKGFTRLENLNEHLRRCHTSGEDDASSVQGGAAGATADNNLVNIDGVAVPAVRTERLGDKRKANDDDQDPREGEEVKRLRGENQGLLGQIQSLQNQLRHYQQNNEALKKQVVVMMANMRGQNPMADGSGNAGPGNGNADPSAMTLFGAASGAGPY